eukprot:COSAG02_NODE_5468_length_4297_cov_3.717008_3_plen_211_part_00
MLLTCFVPTPRDLAGCALFGRDEAGGNFSFTQQQVDTLCGLFSVVLTVTAARGLASEVWPRRLSCHRRLTNWHDVLMGIGITGRTAKPTADRTLILELVVSDANKTLLLANPLLLPYLISGLFLDPDHPRADLKDEIKLWNQQTHAECLAQLTLFPAGRDAMLENAAVTEALVAVAERGMSEEASESAKVALKALSGEKPQMRTEGDKHM